MGNYLDRERPIQAALKHQPGLFSTAAGADGVYYGRSRPFCLPQEHADENLFVSIRQPAQRYFSAHRIKWHQGSMQGTKPNNHLCSSQVCCVNFLFPFADQPEALAALLQPCFPTLRRMLPIEATGEYVAFEWIGARDYLGEQKRAQARTRGANCTSADAAVCLEHEDGTRQIVLIEWKFTESYGMQSIKVAASGTDRSATYRPLLSRADGPLDTQRLTSLDDLYYEPFYQLMRQQLLAHEMEKAHENGADKVSVLHISPAANADLRKVTSRGLGHLGGTCFAVWANLQTQADRFRSVTIQDLFGPLPVSQFPALANWHQYIQRRYASAL
jgi:hypothetical protein